MAADDAMIDLACSPKRAPDASAPAEQKPASAISAFDPFVAGASPAPKADAAGSSSLGMPAEIAAAFEANKAGGTAAPQASAQPTTSPDALMQAILEDAKRMREQSGSKGDDPFAGME